MDVLLCAVARRKGEHKHKGSEVLLTCQWLTNIFSSVCLEQSQRHASKENSNVTDIPEDCSLMGSRKERKEEDILREGLDIWAIAEVRAGPK